MGISWSQAKSSETSLIWGVANVPEQNIALRVASMEGCMVASGFLWDLHSDFDAVNCRQQGQRQSPAGNDLRAEAEESTLWEAVTRQRPMNTYNAPRVLQYNAL
jgi:hypothetical protein